MYVYIYIYTHTYIHIIIIYTYPGVYIADFDFNVEIEICNVASAVLLSVNDEMQIRNMLPASRPSSVGRLQVRGWRQCSDWQCSDFRCFQFDVDVVDSAYLSCRNCCPWDSNPYLSLASGDHITRPWASYEENSPPEKRTCGKTNFLFR